MKVGMLTGLWYIAEGASLLGSLPRVARLGFRYVDLHGVFHAGPEHLTPDQRMQVKETLDRLGLIPRNYILHPRHNLASASQAELDDDLRYLSEGIDLAALWGVNQLMLNAGQWAFGVSRTEAWDRAAGFLRRLCDRAVAKGAIIAIEPEPYVWFLISDLASARKMLDDVARPNLAILVDLGHMALAREGKSDLASVEGRVVHAHFSDHQPYMHTNQILGTGFVPTSDYLRALAELQVDRGAAALGYDELVISLELGMPGQTISDPDGWARQSLDFVLKAAPGLTLE
jgi:sugar phosphate isomerase/epimerase